MTYLVGSTVPGLAGLLQEHPAVAQAQVASNQDGAGWTAWIVPDSRAAAMLHRSAMIEESGRLGALAWHEPADDLRVAGFNRGETDFLYREIFQDGSYFRDGIRLPPNAVVVDVGANIGMFSLRTALDNADCRILAVEPISELAEAVRINSELHNAAVTVVCAALGSAESEANFTFYPHNSVMSGRFADMTEDAGVLKGYLRTGDGSADDTRLDRLVAGRLVAEHRRVPVTTLAALVAAHGVPHIDLLKIDVEKAEMDVLAGIGDALWPVIDRIAVEVHDIDGRLGAVLGLLRDRGYLVDAHQDPRLVLTPCHTVYARRPEAAPASVAEPETVPVRFGGGPTLRRLETELRQLLADRRPEVQAPEHFVVVTDLARAQAREPAPAPRHGVTRRTAALAAAWSALFGAEALQPDADFFDLGGTSLSALRLLDRVEQELGPGLLTAELIFATSTFGALADAMEAGVDH
jgi:FkbM family methyltransferase